MEWEMWRNFDTITHRLARRWAMRGRCGTVMVEFAIAAPLFVALIVGVVETGFDLFVQGSLDTAVKQAARSVQIGTVQGYAGETSNAFASAAVCPALPAWLSCSQVVVGVAPVSGDTYYGNPAALTLAAADKGNTAGAICTGQGGQTMLIQAWYKGPTIVGALIPSFSTTYNGAVYHITSASAGFVNEYFNGGQSSGVGC